LQHGHEPGYEGLVEDAIERADEGWKFLRWGLPTEGDLLEPSRMIQEATAQFRAVRNTLGDDIELCFDIHTRLSPPEAIQLCRAVEPYRPYFMEDPVRSESPQCSTCCATRSTSRWPWASNLPASGISVS
jgi:galactonate dehydratase